MTDATPFTSPRYPGRPVDLGDRVLVIPPLAAEDLRRFRSLILQARQATDAMILSRLDEFVALIHAAARRNYPDLERAEIAAGLDARSIVQAFWAALGYTPPAAAVGAPSTN